ncbi:hypothetical protein GCM10027090_13440 [Sinomonas soli]
MQQTWMNLVRLLAVKASNAEQKRPPGGGCPTLGGEKTGAECWGGAVSSAFDSSMRFGRRVSRRGGGLRLQVLLSLCSQ